METIYNFLPNDLVNIIEEYSIDNEIYHMVINELQYVSRASHMFHCPSISILNHIQSIKSDILFRKQKIEFDRKNRNKTRNVTKRHNKIKNKNRQKRE